MTLEMPTWIDEHLEQCFDDYEACGHPAHLDEDDIAYLAWCETLDPEEPDPGAEWSYCSDALLAEISGTDEQLQQMRAYEAYTAAEAAARQLYGSSLAAPTTPQLTGMVRKVLHATTANDKVALLLWAAERITAYRDAGHMPEKRAHELIRVLTREVGLDDEHVARVESAAWRNYLQSVARWIGQQMEAA